MPFLRLGRLAPASLLAAAVVLAASGPGTGAAALRSAESRHAAVISGHVFVRDTGAPYPGVSVEFRNLLGGNVHGETDANGYYALPVPPDVYTALAVDLANTNAGFDVVGRSSNAVSVPPSTTVDFAAYPIVDGGEPVP